ncbi:E3 ubiquitin-protein ligase RBBP6 isoform X2 [Echeneis naucrates]|uniref:E3 ubiquitin-protein ligase RBBP6 isoform X2 n=1 Tax=Echeneis naucrates TaxID=173247 RepID=UPI001113C864|nr:E3 ubiquitin-protein ligase RBBP6 isoform X2 [Echeneis naucrates]
MTHVHYKFSSKLSYDTVVFDGPHITLADLKRQIMGREKLRAGDCDLQITNAQTKQEYTDDEGLIPKGSSVIVRRIPITGGKSHSSSKTQNTERSDVQLQRAFAAFKAMDDQTSSSALPFFSKMANLADANVSEEDKIKVMQNQSTYDSMNYNKKFSNVLPANYTCYRCGNTGHHIRNCPTSGDKNFEGPLRIKKSTGIPRSFMVEVDDPNIKGAMLTNCGRYAIPAIDAEAYAIGKKEKPPFVPQEQPKSPQAEQDPIPDELLCLICHDLLSDAVVIPCCGNSYCDDCIRTTLLDSEEHVCPTCSQSNVSPDTLIANKFLRQAVNNFRKERGFTKTLAKPCVISKSQNPTPTPSPVPTPPPLTLQSQSQRPQQLVYRQQDSLLHLPQAEDTMAWSENPPATTGPTPACYTPINSLQTEQSCLEVPDKDADGDSTAIPVPASTAVEISNPSVLVSNKESTAVPPQLIPLVNPTKLPEQPKTFGVNQQQFSLGSALGLSGPSTSWGSSSSPSGCPIGGWTKSQQLTCSSPSSSSSSSHAAPSFFPSPLFPTYLSAHQSLSSYPPGYPPTTPMWTLPCPQGAPIPSLCSSTSSSSIPALIPKDWYKHQGKKKERSPHRGSSYRHSSSRSKSSKSSCSYSRSSSRSRSRSRSRSHGRSRPRSSYSRHKDRHNRSHHSISNSYGYKRPRSPTPSSSSSPHVGYLSRSKSPSDHRKNRHHHTKKSASCSRSSRSRGEHSGKEDRSSGPSSATSSCTDHVNQTNSLELERKRYLQWKNEYKEWCEKYFSSYVNHFHQLPPPFINLPPPPPQWEGSKNHSQPNSDSHYQHTAQMDGCSPPSQSSSDNHSPSSQSSSDSHSTPSQSSSDSRSSPSHMSNKSPSPPSQLSSDGRATPFEDGAQPRPYQQQKDEPKRRRKHEEERGEESSFSTDDSKKDERGHVCDDEKAAASDTLKLAQHSLKLNKSSDKDYDSKGKRQKDFKAEKVWKRGNNSDCRQDAERQHKIKPSKEAVRGDSERYNNAGGSKAPEPRSEKDRKRKGENLERNETHKNESPNSFDSKKQKTEKKTERKTWSPTERPPLWEGGITVKPQRKISININLDGKRKEEKTEKEDSIMGKSKDEIGSTGDREEMLKRDTDLKVDENRGSVLENEGLFEDIIKPDVREAKPLWEKATFRENKKEMWDKIAQEKKEDGEEDDVHLWYDALRGVKEETEESKTQWEGEGMKAIKREEVTTNENKEVKSPNKEIGGHEEGELVRKLQWKREKGESPCKENRGNLPGDTFSKEALMEGVKRGIRKEEEKDIMFMSKWSRADSHFHRSNLNMDDSSNYEEMRTVVTTLEECRQERATEGLDQLPCIQVPHSKWESNEPEADEDSKGEIKAPAMVLPSLLVTTNRETEGESELRQRSVERENDLDKDRVKQKSGDKEKNVSLSSLDRNVAPSSGKDRTDHTRKEETERVRDRARVKERERPKDREKESKRSKERTREGERGRDRGREGEHSFSSVQNHYLSPTDHVASYSMYQGVERRDRQRGGEREQDKRSSSSGSRERSSQGRAAVLPDKNTHKTYGDMLLDTRRKDKKYPHDYHGHRDPSGSYRHQGRPTGTHHSSPSDSHSQGTTDRKEKSQATPELQEELELKNTHEDKGEYRRGGRH